jgi:hypothetical protein
MTTDFRALCAELADELHDFQWAVQEAGVGWACPDTESLIDRARAALAEPEPEGPTEQEWDALVESAWDKYMTVGYQGERFIYERDFDTALGFVREELARWGNNTSRSNFDD